MRPDISVEKRVILMNYVYSKPNSKRSKPLVRRVFKNHPIHRGKDPNSLTPIRDGEYIFGRPHPLEGTLFSMQDDLSLQKGVQVCGMSIAFLRAFVIGLPLHVIIRVLY